MSTRLRSPGFTLLELAIVLVIISLVVGTSMMATIGVLESTKRDITQKKMDEIEKALLAFRLINNRLPCPSRVTLSASSANFGLEADTPGQCAGGTLNANFSAVVDNGGFMPNVYYGAEGGVPVRALNLPDEYAYDGWGRRFAYGVNPIATYLDSYDYFDYHLNNNQCISGLVLKDSVGGSIIAYPAYILLSFGANGHGGYSASSTRVNTGSTNTDEQKNCHCNAALVAQTYEADYVAHAATEDPTGGPNFFDDIVRYKDRWQLQGYDEQFIQNDKWPVAAVISTTLSTTPTMEWRSCGINISSASMGATSGGQNFILEYTPNATHLFSVSMTDGCLLHKLYYDHAAHQVDMSTVSAVSNCPAWSSFNRAAISDNGIVAMTQLTAPFLQFWQHSNDQLNYIGTASLSPVLTVRPAELVFSPKGEYLAVSDHSTYIKMYRRKGNSYNFVQLSGQPAGGFIPVVMAFSPMTVNGQYFAMALGSPSTVSIWKITAPGTFTYVRNVATPATGIAEFITFTPNGDYMAIGGGNDNTVANEIVIYKIEPEDRFVSATVNGTHTFNATIMDGGFMSDSRMLGVERNPFSIFLVKTGPLTFMYYAVSAGSGIAGTDKLPMAFR